MPRALPLLALALGAALAAPAVARAGTVQVIKDGRVWGALESYDVGENVYLGLREAARVYGAQLYWYPVRGQVAMTIHGRTVAFQEDSTQVSVDGKTATMPRALIVRMGRAFAPVEFLADPVFADVSGLETAFDPKTRVLRLEARADVGPLRWYSYADHTRFVLELKPGMRYAAVRREAGGFEVSVPGGVVDEPRSIRVRDGVVDAARLEQDSGQARLELSLEQGAGEVRVMDLDAPRRVVLDVMRRAGSAPGAHPAGATLPAPAAPAAPAEPPKTPAPKPAPTAVPAAAPVPPPAPEAPPAAAPASSEATPPPAAAPEARPVRRPLYRICVDAGHGGKDGGTTGRRGTLEKDVNLAAALQLAKLLRADGRFDVMLTRSDDRFVKLGDRARMANDAHADLFVSLHSNANPSRGETGYEVYFLSEKASDPEAARLAEVENSVRALENGSGGQDPAADILYRLARTEFINEGAELAGYVAKDLSRRVDLPDRGVKQASFYVLRGAAEPAILVEMGFLSNAEDEAKLDSAKYRERIVQGVYAGIVDYVSARSVAGGQR